MPEYISSRVKRRRADLGRANPVPNLRSSIRSVTTRHENRRHAKMYTNKRWKGLRLAVLEEFPLCKFCGEAATTVDHIMPHMGNWKLFLDVENMQSLCKSCHDKKTRIERKVPRMGSRLTPFPRPRKGTAPDEFVDDTANETP